MRGKVNFKYLLYGKVPRKLIQYIKHLLVILGYRRPRPRVTTNGISGPIQANFGVSHQRSGVSQLVLSRFKKKCF